MAKRISVEIVSRKSEGQFRFVIGNGYEVKETLKANGYVFNPKDGYWTLTIPAAGNPEEVKAKVVEAVRLAVNNDWEVWGTPMADQLVKAIKAGKM